MKKLIALLLVAVLALGLAACGGKNNENNDNKETTESTASQTDAPASAVEVLETIWGAYGEEDKFSVMGGDYTNPVDNAPGALDLTTTDFLIYNLLVPEAEVANITEAASLIHAMNANTFTCGVYKVADADAFAATMKDAVLNNQWMCGFPETLVIADIGGYVLVAYGVNDAMTPFQSYLTGMYPDAQILVNEAIEG